MKTVVLGGHTFDMPEKFGYMYIAQYESNRDSEYNNWRAKYPNLAMQIDAEAKSESDAEFNAIKEPLVKKADELEAALENLDAGSPEYATAEKLARDAGDELLSFEETYNEHPSALGKWYIKYGTPYIPRCVLLAILEPQPMTKVTVEEALKLATGTEIIVPVNFFLESLYGKRETKSE